ncbi:cellulose binding domain-containing protein [Micromonospora sp. WMMD1128]|uniref:cellulose binding domain-containing protein n=1 Tax=unclassified Micromonospora TaxID=2617518 RepID=UPI00248C6F90|nr:MULTISPECIES: cellulose binding domain-containing protein [unclassified Micromonospora]WBB75863.1 cellulose binding domain-containing protein [Micromonospora sp. WMMD1128]WFE36348.1 cellulose binding domain-containing protein [Micromonospora sp. WMMD975]
MTGVSPSTLFRRLRPGPLAAVVLSTAVLATALSVVPEASAGTVPSAAYPGVAPAPGGAAVAVADPSGTPPSTPTTAPSTPNTSPFPPTAPTDLTASEVRTGSVTLTWTAAKPGCCPVVGYDITYYQAFSDVIYSASVGNVTTTTITNYLSPGRQFSFRLAARDSLGHRSATSDTLTVVTPVTDTGPDTTPPSAPQNLTVGEVTASTGTLSWSPSTDDVGVLGYNVYRFDGWFTSTLIATVPGTTYTASLPPSTPLRTLYYVRARDAAGNVSIASNTVSLPTTSTPPPPPPATCRVTYRNQSEWRGGFVATVTVENTGAAPIDGWIVSFGFPGDQQVTSAWNATVGQTGAAVTARNVDWNRVLAPDGSATFGIQGRWGASDAPPTAFTLNGAPCAVG